MLSKANGVVGQCTGDGFSGVFGESRTGPGVSGSSATSVGVDAKSANGPAALRATHAAGGLAGLFVGDVRMIHDLQVDHDITVMGDIRISNGDCAEEFDIAGAMAVEPGTVMGTHRRG